MMNLRHGCFLAITFLILLPPLLALADQPIPPHDHAAMLSAQAAAQATQPASSFLGSLFEQYVPRRICMNNESDVIWLNLISDAIIALSYFTIPIALIYFIRRRKDVAFNWIFLAFAVFILACGMTHVFSVIAIFDPFYRLDGIVKAITAAASIITAIALWTLMPKALAIPSPAMLRVANEDLRRARAAADSANEAKSQFLANISHEIRTPMSAIIGYSDLLLDPTRTPSDQLEYVNVIRQNSRHLLTLVNDVLDLSKIEAGKLAVEIVECSPCKILADVASMMRVRAVEKDLHFHATNDGFIPQTVRTDPTRLYQILINLVGNAVKFTEKGTVRVVMKLEESSKPVLRFDIIDTGIGLTADEIARLFKPFAQADESMTRRFGGTGLGLTICKQLAKALGGRIEVASQPGAGSTFSLIIDPGPMDNVKRLQNCREALTAGEWYETDLLPTQFKGRILLVDDGEDNRKLLSIYIRRLGVSVELAENGWIGCEKALAALAAGQPFDLIFMDMQMPELDGYAAASRLRTKGLKSPIVAVTAHVMVEDRKKCMDAGCTDYMGKPVLRADLTAMVARYLQPAESMLAADPPTPAPAASAPTAAALPLEPNAVIRSELSTERLRPLLINYVAELPQKVAAMRAHAAKDEFEALENMTHDLIGTGGLFGLMPISTAARKVEEAITRKNPRNQILRDLDSLIEIIRRVEGYDRSVEATRDAHEP